MSRTFAVILSILFVWPIFAEEKEGGIIGTGVIGQITGLEQFEVSGMQFAFSPDLELKGVGAVEDLRLGMTVALATGREGTAWQIMTLQHMPLLSGPITAPGEVMGVPVSGALPISGAVQIDGFWTETGIVASRVTRTAQDTVQATGIYDGRGQIGLVSVQGEGLSEAVAGQTVTVRGRFVGETIVAESVMRGPFMEDPPDLVLLEGFFQPMPANATLGLQGIAIASTASEDGVRFDELVRRCALHGRTDFLRSALSPSEEELVTSFCVSASN